MGPQRDNVCRSSTLQQMVSPTYSLLGFTPVGDGDYSLERLLQAASSPAEIAVRVRDLCELPRGDGLQALVMAISTALPSAPVLGQQNCMEALCALCSGGAGDAHAARALANAMLLSNCGQVPCTPWQLSILRSAAALSETQRSKLMMLARPDSW